MKHIYKLMIFSFLLAMPLKAKAGICETLGDWYCTIRYNVIETWNDHSSYDLFVPLYAWHNRLTYDREHIKKYNENPWGAGLGMSRFDEDGDWHSLYAMYFKDSNGYGETMFGYAFLKNHNWHDVRLGYGFTIGATQRHEYSYIPVPLPLPLIGIGYGRVDLQAAYVPGIKNDGNVLFIWTRISLY